MSEKLKSELKDYLLPRLKEEIGKAKPLISFEFFPPKTDEMEEKLWQSVKKLEPLKPRFVSVTYGAGGSTREKTHKTVVRILKETSLKPAAHLTCVGATKEEIDEIAKGYWQTGVKHIVALRGDPPKGVAKYTPHPGGYAYTVDLVKGLKKIGDFEISVASFPEKHPEAASFDSDIDYLKQKLDSGATRAITQYFFDVDLYMKFLEKVRAKGINAPIVPGIVPIGSYNQIVKFSAMCGATVPDWIGKLLSNLDNDPKTHETIAAMIAVEQCRLLIKAGVKEFHFYTLNRADLAYAVCHALGIRP